MTFFIRTPAGTDRYSLVSDLKVLASDVESHLDNLQTSINLCVRENTSPAFNTITTASPPIFPGITLTGPRSMSSIINNVDGFGLKSQSLTFTTTDSTSWTSNGHINIPSNGSGTQAVNGSTLTAALASRDATISNLSARLTTLENTAATKTYVDSADNALSARITTAQQKANLVDSMTYHVDGNNTKAYLANYADSAGYAGSAGSAGNANSLAGRYWNMGVYPAGTIQASGGNFSDVPTIDKYIPHGLGVSPVAVVVTPSSDTGQHSIVCSIGGWDATNIQVKLRNLNVNTAEDCSLSWVAIA